VNRRHFLNFAGTSSAAAFAFPAIIRAKPASNDISLIREILTVLHPGLYRYQSPMEIEAGLKTLEKTWVQTSALDQRYLSLARFLATIKCGHSYPNFFNQSDRVKQELFDRPTRLPFTFKWIGEQMVVLDGKGSGLPRGSVIKAINGVPVAEILKTLLPYVRADGSNNGKRRALLSATGADGLETFDIFHGLIYDHPAKGLHRLRYRAPGTSRDSSAEVPVISLAERMAQVPQKPQGDEPEWDWTMRADGIAVLKMDGWGLYNSKWDWQSWLNDRLDSLKGTKGLIVDIRENEGGLDCGDVILSRLAGKDIVRPKARRLVRYAKVPEQLNKYLDTWDDGFRDWSKDVERYDDRFFLQKGAMADSVILAKGPHIDVPMAVLTSPQNSSATFQFADLVRSTGLGTLIGETTGGNQRGINGGAFFFARLPESGIEFDVPLIGYFPEGPMPPDAGLKPDIAVSQSAKDIAAGNDPAMTKAVAYLNAR
jgi:Peptidase family S41